MRLRTELLLLFGLMTILMGGVVYYSQHATRQILMGQIEDELAAPAFPDLLSKRTFALRTIGMATARDSNLDINRTHLVSGAMNMLLKSGVSQEEIIKTLVEARSDDGKKWTRGGFYNPEDSFEKLHAKNLDEAWALAWISLQSLAGDTLLTSFNLGNQPDAPPENPLDLLILTNPVGRVLVEERTDAGGQAPPPEPGLPQTGAATRAVLDRGLNGELFKQEFMVHGDNQLYLTVSVPAGYTQDTSRGLLLLGSRIDKRFLDEAKNAAGTGVFAVAVVHGQVEKPFVVGSTGAPPEIDADLLGHWGELTKAEGARQIALGQRRYLLTLRPLGGVGSVVFLKPLSGIERQLDEQTAGIVTVGVAILGFCFVGVLMTTRRITRPIEELAASMVSVGHGDLSAQASPGGTWEVAQAAESFNQMVTGLRQKEEAMKFLPQQTREEIQTHAGVQMGGQRIKATILFSDLRGFTSLSEKLPPQEVVELLNEYLNRMTEVVLQHGGDVNEFIGDAILAVFRGPKGAEQAVDAALAMNIELVELQKITTNQHLKEMRQGIGINTGELVAGNIGTAERKKGAVVGDTVNLAARIQDRSRNGKHTCILVSDDTRQDLPHRLKTELFGDEEFKGKSQPVRVWEVLG